MAQPAPVRNQVFVSYAHADEEYLNRLRKHLVQLERRDVTVWTDKNIEPGMVWSEEITKALASAKVAVLMISTDFLASDFITNQELPALLEAAHREGVRILPVLVKPSTFGDMDVVPLSRYQAVNMNKVLSGLSETDRETEFVNIFQAIRKNIETPTGATAPATARPPAQRAAPEAEPEEEEESEDPPIDEALYADLETLLEDPDIDAMTVQASNEDDAVELLLVTEGRDGSVLVELFNDEEVPPEFHLSRQARRHLVEGLGFNPPEHRGERFWAMFGEDEEVDLEALTDTLLTVLGDVYGLPSDDFDISWEFVGT